MVDIAVGEANRLKQAAGQQAFDELRTRFQQLQDEGIILSFKEKENFSHRGYSYQKQYLASFILKTIDDKYVVINSSSSYRHDRMKLQAYDILGISENASISKDIIASILLYPDSEIEKSSLNHFRKLVEEKKAYSPSTHIFVLSELLVFLENHKSAVELQRDEISAEIGVEVAEAVIKNGSYYGLRGNAFELEIVDELNNTVYFDNYLDKGFSGSKVFDLIVDLLVFDLNIDKNKLISIFATNTVVKLKSGGNSKTDIILELETRGDKYLETISVKSTTQKSVTCHDYKAVDFTRVLGVEDTKLEYYFNLYQEAGSNSVFLSKMSDEDSPEEFKNLLGPYAHKLSEWALKGDHDFDNLINPIDQVSRYLLIRKNSFIHFESYDKYIEKIFSSSIKLVYGVPFQWTYPSKMRGNRIQLKMPVLI